ncbi:hypothetical protein CLM82_11960, partial [Streptomyces albidoflavus]|uniref:NADP-dependent isocitrate dehydrogenase n=1 Tax=Streptomyces albidoflavus TaxID=1886 RepID=UPI000BD4563B
AALREFLTAQIAKAKAEDVLFSVHLKATMMKVSDLIIFGHVVRALFPNTFAQYGPALAAAGLSPNDGLGGIHTGLEGLAYGAECNASFHPDLPAWAMHAGADVCVTSVHKMGSGLEQGSVFHLQGDLVDPAALRSREDLLGTTSSSVLIYAALDGWRRQMVQHGRALYDDALALATSVRARAEEVDGLHVHGREDFCGPGRAVDLDPLQLIIDVSGLGVSGYRAVDALRTQGLSLHFGDHRRINAQLTHADDAESADALLAGLHRLAAGARGLPRDRPVEVPGPDGLRTEQVVLPRDAFFGPVADVPWQEAEGRVAAEMLTPYPPGIPAALPGERLTREVLRYLRTGVEAGMVVPDAADPGLDTVRVVVEG